MLSGQRRTDDAARVALSGPIYGLINLFIHILRNPSLPTVESDIILMGTSCHPLLVDPTELQMVLNFCVKSGAQTSAIKVSSRIKDDNVHHLTVTHLSKLI